jgi:hypothetical protein
MVLQFSDDMAPSSYEEDILYRMVEIVTWNEEEIQHIANLSSSDSDGSLFLPLSLYGKPTS